MVELLNFRYKINSYKDKCIDSPLRELHSVVQVEWLELGQSKALWDQPSMENIVLTFTWTISFSAFNKIYINKHL